MIRIAVLVSGSGTNLQAIIDRKHAGYLPNGEIVLVVSSNPHAYALQRAKEDGIETAVVCPKDYTSQEAFDEALLKELKGMQVEMIVLAGYLCILSKKIIQAYPRRILNVHPSLIPSFCGKGYYGLKVHQAVLKHGVKITGATVHYVNEIPDGGEIIYQKPVWVKPKDTPEALQKRVMEQAEWLLLPKAVRLVSDALEKEKRK